MIPFQFNARTTVLFGTGKRSQIGAIARTLGFRRTLLVADQGLVQAGHVAAITDLLGIEVHTFHGFSANPDSWQAEAGRAFAAPLSIDSIVGLGGGSSMDCAKAINFLLSCGGRMQDYHGYGKATAPLLPMIAIPTTTGTGSEAQSIALISDPETHVKMACGDPQAAFKVAILDPELALSQPRRVRATAGYDALSHAVETLVTTKRNAISDCYSRQAWHLLAGSFARSITHPEDIEAIANMQIGAYLAGAAIENGMLGAAHATANPLTARYGTVHGDAIALMLPHVVRWNGLPIYAELHQDLPAYLTLLAETASLPATLRQAGVEQSLLTELAEDASNQWTGRFNPKPFDAAAALELYQRAY
ncbi:MAG: iron-containing alcohol dehydrogenase [Acidobacteriia bacterium]|nr:iron-containing alcohol dehydrogenase [Terriglobia bacterium]